MFVARPRVPCTFFNQPGGCYKGDGCTFLHATPGPRSVRQQSCHFFSKAGSCIKGDKCSFLHTTTATIGPSRSNRTCDFFNRPGGCSRGDQCSFLHIMGESTSPVYSPSHIPVGVCTIYWSTGQCDRGS